MRKVSPLVLGLFVATLVGCGPTDSTINLSVKQKLAADDSVKAAAIEASTQKKVVTLTGTVDSQQTKDRAATDARQAVGVTDVINQLIDGHGYAIYSLDAAGAELSEIVAEAKWAKALTDEGSKTLLLSGGGNDLLGDHFGDYLRDGVAPGSTPNDFLNTALDDALHRVLNYYGTIIQRVKDDFPGVKVFTHSYDFALPRPHCPDAARCHPTSSPHRMCH